MNIDPEILPILNGLSFNGNQVKIVQRLTPDVYRRVNKVLECLGGKWNRKAQAHVFDCDPREAINQAVDGGKVTDTKKEIQFFPTPPALARKMVMLADLKPHHSILEPSAGQGAICDAIVESQVADGCRRPDILKRLWVCEIFPKHQEILLSKGYKNQLAGDFLQQFSRPTFDRIIANPPFTKDQDIQHIRKMYEMLAPGGMIVTLTWPGWTYASNRVKQEFLDWIRGEGFFTEEIPEGTFEDTSVRTILVVITKPVENLKSHRSGSLLVGGQFRILNSAPRKTVTVQPTFL